MRSLIEKLFGWTGGVDADSQHLQEHWLAERYPGCNYKRLKNGRWWVTSRSTGLALGELDARGMIENEHRRSAILSADIEREWLVLHHPGATLSAAGPGLWDVLDPLSGKVITRLRLEVNVTVSSHHVPLSAVPTPSTSRPVARANP